MSIEQFVTELADYVDVKEDKAEDLAEYLGGKMLTPEGVRKYTEKAITLAPTAEERQAIQPVLDKYFNKGLETWKSNHLDNMIEEEVTKRTPGETEEMKRIRVLEEKLKESDNNARRLRLESHATNIATEQGLPTEIVSHFVGPDEEATEANLERLKNTLEDHVAKIVKARFKDGGRDVHNSSRGLAATDIDKLKAQYAEADAKGMKLQDKIKLSRQIQQLEQQRE